MTFYPNHAFHSEYPFTKLITVNQPCIVIKQNKAHWNRFCMYEWYCCLVIFINHFTYTEISHIDTYMHTPWQRILQRDGRGKEGNGFQSSRSSPLFLQTKHSPVKSYKEVVVLLHISLTSILHGDKWSTSHPDSCVPRKKSPGNYWIT